jgi:hypothetical protein
VRCACAETGHTTPHGCCHCKVQCYWWVCCLGFGIALVAIVAVVVIVTLFVVVIIVVIVRVACNFAVLPLSGFCNCSFTRCNSTDTLNMGNAEEFGIGNLGAPWVALGGGTGLELEILSNTIVVPQLISARLAEPFLDSWRNLFSTHDDSINLIIFHQPEGSHENNPATRCT